MADFTEKSIPSAGGERRLAIFSRREKEGLAGFCVANTSLDRVEFLGANLRNASFRNVSLFGSDFVGADLRGAEFVGCDLRQARFAGARFGGNRFDGSWLIGATGLTDAKRRYVAARGGGFLKLIRTRGSQRWR
jgi:uncharacterized protein YjbI with pentapeptide repeats